MRLIFTIFLAMVACIVGWVTEEIWFGIALFIGGMVSFLMVYEEDSPKWDHLSEDAGSKTPLEHNSDKNKDNGLWFTLLGALGMAWLMGKDKDDK